MRTETNKKHRKFRAMTYREFCRQYKSCCECPIYDERFWPCNALFRCDKIDDPFKTKDGKYLLIEVTNNA